MSCRYVSVVYYSLSPQLFFKTTEWLLIQKIGNDIFPCPAIIRTSITPLVHLTHCSSRVSFLGCHQLDIKSLNLNDIEKRMHSLKSRNLANLSSYVGKIKRRIPLNSTTFCILTCRSFFLKCLGMNSSLAPPPAPPPFPYFSLPLLFLPLPSFVVITYISYLELFYFQSTFKVCLLICS